MFLQLRYWMRLAVKSPPVPLRVLVLVVSILAYGATGYLYFELPVNPELTWLDGIWYSVVTVTTVGYGDLSPATLGGRFVVAFPLMFVGIGLLGYVLSVAASALVEAKTKELHGMSSYRFKNHLVIINATDLDKVERVLDELQRDPQFGPGREVIVVDADLQELPPELRDRGAHFIRGNPTRDETLTRANVDEASHAVVLTKDPGDSRSDGLNVTITLAIEARSSRVVTVVECIESSTEELLRKAGCDRVVCSSRFDAHFLSHELLSPGIQEIIAELTTNQRGQQIYLTAFEGKTSSYGSVAETCRARGHLPLGVRRGRETLLNPRHDFELEPGDRVVTIGNKHLGSLLGA